ncbi:MAG: cysteine desulfurase [Rickettsiales bacterium]|nr:cysteine desulfurase [Rickettsiales bacterium]
MATYLDYNATSPLLPEVQQAMVAVLAEASNASSVHAYGRTARGRLETAREQILQGIGAEGYGLVFTSGGTEANHLALRGLDVPELVTVTSAVEHPSIIQNAKAAITLPVDGNGVVKLDVLETLLQKLEGKKALVSVMLANNETGVIQPVPEIAALVYQHGGYVHTDASQAIGRIPVDITALNVDMVTVSPHKFGGPLGTGALIYKKGLPLRASQHGGGQESNLRAGTENVPAIVGFAAAVQALADYPQTSTVRDAIEEAVLCAFPDVRVIGANVPRLPNTSCVLIPGVSGETQVIALDLEGFAVSSGSACTSGKVEASHVLQAMGVPPEDARCAIRISTSWQTQPEEVERFTDAWIAVIKRIRNKAAGKAAA